VGAVFLDEGASVDSLQNQLTEEKQKYVNEFGQRIEARITETSNAEQPAKVLISIVSSGEMSI
jgi:hypothetical protein